MSNDWPTDPVETQGVATQELPQTDTPSAVEHAGSEAFEIGASQTAMINDIAVSATVELGRTSLPIRDVLGLRRGSIVELDKLVGQPAELLINNTPLAKGEIVVVNERFGFKIINFVTTQR